MIISVVLVIFFVFLILQISKHSNPFVEVLHLCVLAVIAGVLAFVLLGVFMYFIFTSPHPLETVFEEATDSDVAASAAAPAAAATEHSVPADESSEPSNQDAARAVDRTEPAASYTLPKLKSRIQLDATAGSKHAVGYKNVSYSPVSSSTSGTPVHTADDALPDRPCPDIADIAKSPSSSESSSKQVVE